MDRPVKLNEEIAIPDDGSKMSARQIKVADWDRDGKLDLIALRSRYKNQRNIMWYRNVGTATKPELADGELLVEDHDSAEGEISGFCVADWNNDGRPDVIVARNTVKRYKHDGRFRTSRTGRVFVYQAQ